MKNYSELSRFCKASDRNVARFFLVNHPKILPVLQNYSWLISQEKGVPFALKVRFPHHDPGVGNAVVHLHRTRQRVHPIDRHQAGATTSHSRTKPKTRDRQLVRNQTHEGIVLSQSSLHAVFFVPVYQSEKDGIFFRSCQNSKGVSLRILQTVPYPSHRSNHA